MTSASRVPVLYQNKCPLSQEDKQKSIIKNTLPYDRCIKAYKEFDEEQELREIKQDLVSFNHQLEDVKTTTSISKKAVYNWVGIDIMFRWRCARYSLSILGFTVMFLLFFYALYCSLTSKPYIDIEVSILLAIVLWIISMTSALPDRGENEFLYVQKKMEAQEYLIGDNVVDCPIMVKYKLLRYLWEDKELYIRFAPDKEELQFFTNTGNVEYWFLNESKDKESVEYQMNYFANQLLPNKLYRISDIITDVAKKKNN